MKIRLGVVYVFAASLLLLLSITPIKGHVVQKANPPFEVFIEVNKCRFGKRCFYIDVYVRNKENRTLWLESWRNPPVGVRIYDKDGKLVYESGSVKTWGHPYFFEPYETRLLLSVKWTGRDTYGTPLPKGNYTIYGCIYRFIVYDEERNLVGLFNRTYSEPVEVYLAEKTSKNKANHFYNPTTQRIQPIKIKFISSLPPVKLFQLTKLIKDGCLDNRGINLIWRQLS